MNTTVSDYLLKLELGQPQTFENMGVIPLFSSVSGGPNYITLKEAMDGGLLEVTEVSSGGSMPNLKVKNGADTSVLLLDGEEVVGAKQNRVLNTTILMKKKSEITIPVSCTEQGRWSYSSPKFQDSDVVLPHVIRRAKAAAVSRSLNMHASFSSDQGEVWEGIRETSYRANVDSPTGALKDVFNSRQNTLNDYVKAFECQPGQRGLLVFVEGEVVGFDLLSRDAAYGLLHPKVVKSYAMDAMLRPKGKDAGVDVAEAQQFVDRARECEEKKYKSVGQGSDYRFDGEKIIGSALVYRNAVVHTAFFGTDDTGEQGGERMDTGRIASFLQRRRSRYNLD